VPNTQQQLAPSSEMIEYYRQVDDLISTEVNQMRDWPFIKSADAEQSIRFLSDPGSLTSLAYVGVAPDRLAANFRAIVDLLRACSPENPLARALHRQPVANDLAALPWSEPISNLENSLLEWAEQREIDGESLLQMLQWAMSPFWRLAAERYADELRQLVTNEKSTCPVCGNYPDFAILDDNEHGRRYLYCLCCNWKWPFKRMGCGYCGNDDSDRLGYVVPEEFKGYKIYCCEQCKSYLKTIDHREAMARLDLHPLLEHVKSLFLDLLAIEKGYLPMHA